ncbi:galactose/methyl galactoside ABC transporter permease MglC [Vallitalea sp.]|jgi:methyl-galactoside transport system permease protein|uniref:galactose/methyl galactoside ABC transporter permease MglC n=1 Tax=Vallitalea sp. TaxID=1882829 RepID=UPI0025EF8031|nr:galactose/methyl galactoside ABC transporter permease MglC [Vallitalea sp.]MCT4687805.1 galactose/methyl galactoside ABC transporter permease MglC [Vallitalea sp.]
MNKIIRKISFDKKKISDLLLKYAIYFVLLIMIIIIIIEDSSIVSWRSLATILTQASTRCMLALGVGGIIVLAGTDLSIGRMVGLAGVVGASLMQSPGFSRRIFPNLPTSGWFIALSILFIILLITFASFINGWLTAKLHITPFIATLGMQLVLYGAASSYYNALGGSPITSLNEGFKYIAQGKLLKLKFGSDEFYISFLMLFALISILFIWFIWNKTRIGKNMFAVGGNAEAAAVSGVSIVKTTLIIYVIAGVLYGAAGLLELGRTGSATNNLGLGYELDAISACVVGGVSLMGGVGSVAGIVTGVIIFQVINFGLAYIGVDPYLQYVVKGMIILIAVAIDTRKYIKKK